jgi:hypothetical protein
VDNIVIFSIDDQSIHGLKKFLKYLDDLSAMGKFKGKPIICTGSYLGKIEVSFITLEEDYLTKIKGYGFTDKQESVMVVYTDHKNRMTGKLLYANGEVMSLGEVKGVTKEKAMTKDSWTYRGDVNKYWVCE